MLNFILVFYLWSEKNICLQRTAIPYSCCVLPPPFYAAWCFSTQSSGSDVLLEQMYILQVALHSSFLPTGLGSIVCSRLKGPVIEVRPRDVVVLSIEALTFKTPAFLSYWRTQVQNDTIPNKTDKFILYCYKATVNILTWIDISNVDCLNSPTDEIMLIWAT